jgi:hypothetical protein
MEIHQLFEKIQAISAINKEIIQRIRGDPSMLSFQGKLQARTQLVVDHTASQREFFGWWRWDGELVAVRDTFKDKVDYARCHTFEELELLNEKLVVFAEQYRAFEDSAFAATELRQYLTNYELIQTALGQVDAQFQANAAKAKNQNRAGQVQEVTREFNVALAKLARLRIHLADLQGRPLFRITPPPKHADAEIRGISAAKNGRLVVIYQGPHGTVYSAIYDASGALVNKDMLLYCHQGQNICGIALDWETGNLIVDDQQHNQIFVLLPSKQGPTFLTSWTSSSSSYAPPPKVGALTKPVGVAVGAGGLIYVTQSKRVDITVVRASTLTVERIIEQASPLHFNDDETKKRASGNGLSGIAVHPITGNIYAADPDNARVLIFTPEGEFEGSFHLGEGHHSYPVGLTIDAKGNVFVTEQQHNRVLVFHSHGGAPLVVGGGAEASLELIRSPGAVAVIGDRVFVVNNKGKNIHVFAFIH